MSARVLAAHLPYIARVLAAPLALGYCRRCGAESAPVTSETGECVPCDIDHTYYLLSDSMNCRGGDFWSSIPDDEIAETETWLNQHLAMLRDLRTKHRAAGSYPEC